MGTTDLGDGVSDESTVDANVEDQRDETVATSGVKKFKVQLEVGKSLKNRATFY